MNTPINTLADVQAVLDNDLAGLIADRQTKQDALDKAHAAEVAATADIAYDAGQQDTIIKVKAYLATLQTVNPTGGSSSTGGTVAGGITQNADGTFQNASGQRTDALGNVL